MTTLAERSRVPAGVTTGGQFAVEARSEADVSLGAPARDWGALNIAEGSRTPWGPAQQVYDIAPGIAEVSCAGHGGIKLSKERNRAIPPALREPSGWYEEDCEAAIPMWAFHEEYAAHRQNTYGSRSGDMGNPGYVLSTSADRIRNWFPNEWEKATGETVTAEQSRVRAEQEFAAAHANDHVVTSASNDPDHPGMVRVIATLGGKGEDRREFLVPKDEYDARSSYPHRFVVDTDRHADVTPPPPPPKPKAQRFTPSVDAVREHAKTMSPAAASRVTRDLAQRWRSDDGTVRTLAELLETEGVTGRSAGMFDDDAKVTYYLQQYEHEGDGGGTILPVSKATWDALASQVPDSRTPREVARVEIRRAEIAVEKARAKPDRHSLYGSERSRKAAGALERAKERLNKATAELERIRREEEEKA